LSFFTYAGNNLLLLEILNHKKMLKRHYGSAEALKKARKLRVKAEALIWLYIQGT
jgi:hypothetical protein